MKKLLLGALLLLSTLSFSQNTFIKKYTSYAMNIGSVISEVKPIDETFVFNEGKSTDIVVYGLTEVKRFHTISATTTGKTTGGYEYQWVDCIQVSTGSKASIQLFDKAVRIFIEGDYIEYQN